MTKEEKIKEAYGKYYEDIKNQISDEGWINENVIRRVFFSDLEFHDLTNSMRPLSLKGIEDNNGWVKIENESDLPKDNSKGYLIFAQGEVKKGTFNIYQLEAGWGFRDITHYQPIQKPQPQPPIY